jgi:dsDNA-binding SOS-regulon protein
MEIEKEKGGAVKRNKHKFNAIKTQRNGFKFDSKKEADYYDQLIMLQRNGDVVFFLRQVPFHLPGNITYRVDFQVFLADGSVEFIDVKGMRTPQYIAKKKMVEALYPVEILEV